MRVKFVIVLSLLCIGLTARAQDIYDAIDTLNRQVVGLLEEGEYVAALDSTKELLKLLDIKPDKRMKAKAVNNAAICYKELGAYDKADACYRESIDLATGASKDLYRFHYSNYLLLIGGWQRAIECLDSITSSKYELQKALNLSSAYFRRKEAGDVDKAISLINTYLHTHDTRDSDYPVAQLNKGYIYWECGRQDSAKYYLQEALNLLTRDESDYYIALGNLAMVKAELHEFDSALTDIETVIRWQMAHIETSRHDYIISLRKKAEILLKARRYKEALIVFKQYYGKEKAFIYATFPDAGQPYRLNYWYSQKPLLSKIFQLGDTDAAFLYDVALFRRQMTLLGNGTADIKQETDIGVEKLKRAMNSDEAAIEFICYYDETEKDTVYAALLAAPGTQTKYLPIAKKRALHGYELADGSTLESGICSLASKVKGTIYTDSILAAMVWSRVCGALPAKTSKVYFAPDGILQMLGIENLPYTGLSGIELHRLTSTANLLHRSTDKIAQTPRALVIGGINYDAGTKQTAGNDSIETNQLAYNYLKEECGLDPASGLFAYLQGSKTEADSILVKLPGADNGDAGRNSEEYLKKHIGEYSLVHLSTHGYSLKVDIGRRPVFQSDSVMVDNTLLASGIALKGANVAGRDGEKEDGLLSARELCDMDNLNGVDLVVLSACQTAQGVVSDEGPAGIVRGLKKAGVHTIMASLWPVDDAATARFMNAFYDALLHRDDTNDETDGEDESTPTETKPLSSNAKYNALRRAQDAVRGYTVNSSTVRFSPKTLSSRPLNDDRGETKTFKPYKDPYYWAPFILIDDI